MRAASLRRLLVGAIAVLGLVAPVPARAAGTGLRLVASRQLDPRLVELTFATPALKAPTNVRILVPRGYDPRGTTRYPVLYLLHGCCDNYRSWTAEGNAEAITEGLPLIVVMPDGGAGGFYSDWYNNGAGGPPEWETYHLQELLPWVDGHYLTIASRGGRGIAGLSMGGFGAMSYAARHPDLFVAAASFSGAVDNMNKPAGNADDLFPLEDGGAPFALWGPQPTQEVRWRAHNPVDLAGNLRGLELTLRTGNGLPGGPYGGGPDPLEAGVHQETLDLHERIDTLGIPHLLDDYGPGAHQWPYWQRDLRETLPAIMTGFRSPPPAPSPFTYTAVEPTYDVYGWHVALRRQNLEFSTLAHAGPAGFALLGSGTADTLTAPLYRPGRGYLVTVADSSGTRRRVLHADSSGRLAVHVDLGPSNPYQEYTPAADAAGTAVRTANVSVSR